MGETAVYPRELKGRRGLEEKAPFRDPLTAPDGKRGVPLCTGRHDGRTKPPKYSQKQKDLGVDRVAPDKL